MTKSILYDIEIMHGAKMGEKSGVTLPRFFSAENIEADAVKDKCVMYDLSDKVKLLIKGKDSLKFANYLGTKVIEKNKITKTIILNDEANIIDIVKVYYLDDNNILVVIGLASFEGTYNYILEKAIDYDVTITSIQDELYQLAFMGIKSKEVLQNYLNEYYKDAHYKPNLDEFIPSAFELRDDEIKIIYHENRLALTYGIMGTSEAIKKVYTELSMEPNCLLGGMDSYNILRKRARRLEYGVDIDSTINPYEASLEALVDFSHDFIGREKLLSLSMMCPNKKFIGVEFEAKNVINNSFEIYYYGSIVGRVTSVCHETSTTCIGVGFIDTQVLEKSYSHNDSLRIKVGNDYIALKIVEM